MIVLAVRLHVHQSLWKDGANAFHDPKAELGMSDLMKNYMAGLIKICAGLHLFPRAIYQQL